MGWSDLWVGLTCLVLGWAWGAVWGSVHSVRVGEKWYAAVETWESLVDLVSKYDRRTRKKLAAAKRKGQEIADKYR